MLYISSDHAGFKLKKNLTRKLKNILKIKFADLGPANYLPDDDFPDYAVALARKIIKKKGDLGVLICGSGHGMCIAANKIAGVRAILASGVESAELGRRDNDANILCLSGRFTSDDHALAIVKTFVSTKFDRQKRRIRRLKKIKELE